MSTEPLVSEVSAYATRTVTPSVQGRRLMVLFSVVAVVIVGVMLIAMAQRWSQSGKVQPQLLIPLALVVVAFFFFRMAVNGERRILEEGELASGKVLNVYTGGRGPLVHYEYADGAGKKYQGSGRDSERRFRPGMAIPVFYDRAHPHRSATVLSTYFDVRPGVH